MISSESKLSLSAILLAAVPKLEQFAMSARNKKEVMYIQLMAQMCVMIKENAKTYDVLKNDEILKGYINAVITADQGPHNNRVLRVAAHLYNTYYSRFFRAGVEPLINLRRRSSLL